MVEGDVGVLEREWWFFGDFFETDDDSTAVVRLASVKLKGVRYILFRSVNPALVCHKSSSNLLKFLIFEDPRNLGIGG